MIIIPTYNCGGFLARTIESALDQTCKVPVIVIDNRSDDRTVSIAEKYKEVELIVNPVNIGRIGNWNRCIETVMEHGPEFFKILFAGDSLKPGSMEKYKKIFDREPRAAMITSAYDIVDDKGGSFINRMIPLSGIINELDGLKKNITIGNWYASPSVQAYRTERIKDLRFREDFPWASDWRFCAEINRENCVYFSREVLSEFNAASRRYYSVSAGKLRSIAEELFLQSGILESLKDRISVSEYKNLDNIIRDRYAARFLTLNNFHRVLYRKTRKLQERR